MELVFDIKSIMQSLPHRYPFLLVDRVVEFVKGKRIVALKNVTINEPFFQGHFPGTPIMPGVLIVEAMGQAGGVLVIQSLPLESRGKLIYFMGFDGVRFRKPVIPGDQLMLKAKIERRSKIIWKFSCEATVDGELCTAASLLCAASPKDGQ